MKVLVVDDSIVFRTQISSALSGLEGVEVVGTAANGRIALQKLEQLSVDLVTLDMEMPELNGIETLKAMRSRGFKTKVIVFSSQTMRGAENALEALRAGADDIVAKPSGEGTTFESAQEVIKAALIPRVVQFMGVPCAQRSPRSDTNLSSADTLRPKKNLISHFSPKALVIASSTGGPAALESIFSEIRGPFKIPILIAQHMPPVFTQILARRLSGIIGSDAREARDGDVIEKGVIYVAPGDYHMVVDKKDKNATISLNKGPLRNSVRPAADYLFESAALAFGADLAGIVLTGMGEDGAVGARVIRDHGGRILIQNKESCVVFGMPGAIYQNDDYDEIGDLKRINDILRTVIL
jgi:two-component system, chemotaxis family, protein-glutamate methylesterase/glutaminase